MESTLVELIDLLTCRLMDEAEREDVIREILAAPTELDWADSEEHAYSIALPMVLHRHTAAGETLDQVHDELREMMGEEFPAYPAHVADSVEYFDWLDPLLREWSDEGGYDIVELDDTCSEILHLFVVRRRDTARILEIAADLGVRAMRPVDYFCGLRETRPAAGGEPV